MTYEWEDKRESYWERVGLGSYTHSRDPDYIAPVNYLFEVGKQLAMHPDKWRQAIEKPNLIQWFVGKVMKETDGRANMTTVSAIFHALAEAKAW